MFWVFLFLVACVIVWLVVLWASTRTGEKDRIPPPMEAEQPGPHRTDRMDARARANRSDVQTVGEDDPRRK